MMDYGYPACPGKIIVLLGKMGPEGEFRNWYLREHSPRLAAHGRLGAYVANLAVAAPPWDHTGKSNGGDPYGVAGIDEIKGGAWEELQPFYTGKPLLGVYSVTEFAVMQLNAGRPCGVKSPEIKRIALLTRPAGKTHDEAMDYWIRRHPDFCLRHHSGLAFYEQNHIDQILTPDAIPLDGFPVLAYWNEDALRYGHFSRKDSEEKMLEDCRNFRSTSFVITVEEYIMKKTDAP